MEFLTSFLNNAANDEDIRNGTQYANRIGIKVTMPKWGLSRSEYFFDKEKNIIAKGLTSIKFMNERIADELYDLAHDGEYSRFIDVLKAIDEMTSVNTRQLDILIRTDFFSQFGNQRELLMIMDLYYNIFRRGGAKSLSKERIDGSAIEDIVRKYSTGVTKSGVPSKNYTILNLDKIMEESNDAVMNLGLEDLSDVDKVRKFAEVMGYVGYVSGNEEDRTKLYIVDIYELRRKKDDKQFGYSFITKSIGSGKDARFTVFNKVYDQEPVKKGDIIVCKGYQREGQYFKMTSYSKLEE